MVNPNTLGEKPKVYGRTNLGRKPRLSYINLVSEPNLITPFQQPKITSDNPHPHPPVENKSATRYAITQILTPRDLQTKATPILTSWDLCNYHQSSRLCLETKNINSTKKKKFKSITSTRQSKNKRVESQHQAINPTNGMTQSHNPPPKSSPTTVVDTAKPPYETLRFGSPTPISTFECHWQSSSMSPCRLFAVDSSEAIMTAP